MPVLIEEVSELLVKGTGIGEERGGKKNVADEIFNLSVEMRSCLCPTNLFTYGHEKNVVAFSLTTADKTSLEENIKAAGFRGDCSPKQ